MDAAHSPSRTKGERIESRENRWLKRFRAALRDRLETENSEIGLEGPRMVEEALRTGLAVEALLVSDAGERHLTRLKAFLPPDVRVLRASERLFRSVSATETPQGIAALVRLRTARLEDMLKQTPLLVTLCGVQDPGNVGTIVRTAEAFGATGVIACRGCAHPLAPKALRASAGSALRLPVIAGASEDALLRELRERGLRQFAASLSGAAGPCDADLRAPCNIWIGGEGAGLPPAIERAADASIRIPLHPPVESLNAAVAAAILLYEAARQRADGASGQTTDPPTAREVSR
jgi:TrmH family RNA methyltransferase